MKISRKKYIAGMLVIVTTVYLLTYLVWIPNLIEGREDEMGEYLELNGYTPVEMTDVNAWTYSAAWDVVKPDSLGNPVEMTVDVVIDGKILSIQPHKE